MKAYWKTYSESDPSWNHKGIDYNYDSTKQVAVNEFIAGQEHYQNRKAPEDLKIIHRPTPFED